MASIHQLLADLLAESAAQRDALSRVFVREHYARWMATLLGPGLDNWRGALTTSQATALFDCHVLRAPPFERRETSRAPPHRNWWLDDLQP